MVRLPRLAAFVMAALALGAWPAAARAEPGTDDLDTGRWYGWQVAMADAGALGLVGQGLLEHKPQMVLGALGVWAAGAPLLHGSNATTARGLLSLGLRLSVPLALGRLAGRMDPTADGPCGGLSCTSDAVAGTAAGLVLVSVIDALLSRSATAPAELDPMAGGWSIGPVVLAGREQTTLGLAGTF